LYEAELVVTVTHPPRYASIELVVVLYLMLPFAVILGLEYEGPAGKNIASVCALISKLELPTDLPITIFPATNLPV
jgi:hypothetical protein